MNVSPVLGLPWVEIKWNQNIGRATKETPLYHHTAAPNSVEWSAFLYTEPIMIRCWISLPPAQIHPFDWHTITITCTCTHTHTRYTISIHTIKTLLSALTNLPQLQQFNFHALFFSRSRRNTDKSNQNNKQKTVDDDNDKSSKKRIVENCLRIPYIFRHICWVR